ARQERLFIVTSITLDYRGQGIRDLHSDWGWVQFKNAFAYIVEPENIFPLSSRPHTPFLARGSCGLHIQRQRSTPFDVVLKVVRVAALKAKVCLAARYVCRCKG